MSYLIDTDICSAYLKGERKVFTHFIQHSGGIHVSILTLAELFSWVYVADEPARTRREEGVVTLLSDATLLGLSYDVANKCGQLRASLQRQGTNVATVDLLIAATALQNDLTVVTHNLRHFQHVPGLRLEDWLN